MVRHQLSLPGPRVQRRSAVPAELGTTVRGGRRGQGPRPPGEAGADRSADLPVAGQGQGRRVRQARSAGPPAAALRPDLAPPRRPGRGVGADRRADPGPRPAAGMEERLRARLQPATERTAEEAGRHLLRRPGRQPGPGRQPPGGRPAHRPGASAGTVSEHPRPPAGLQGRLAGPGQRAQRLALRPGKSPGGGAPCPGAPGRAAVGRAVVLAAAQPGGPGTRRRAGRRAEELAGLCRAEVPRSRGAGPCRH